MSYELCITDNLEHTSKSIYSESVDEIAHIFDKYIKPIINQKLYDDDYASISLETNDNIIFYHYIGEGQWSYEIQLENYIFPTKPVKNIIDWDNMLKQWSMMLSERYTLYKFFFHFINKLKFLPLEELFAHTMHINRASISVTLIIKPGEYIL